MKCDLMFFVALFAFLGGAEEAFGFERASKSGVKRDSVDAEVVSFNVIKPVLQGDNNSVIIKVKNSGVVPITSLTLFYSLGMGDTVWESWTGNLLADSILTYTFWTPFLPNDTGEVTLYGGVKLQGDTVSDNNISSITVHVWPYYQNLPYYENFDEPWENSTNPPYGGWRIIDGGDEPNPTVNTNDWHRYVSTTPPRTVARVYYSPAENSNDWLISPRLKIPGYGTYTLSFWHYYNDYFSTLRDSGQVLISFDDGATWTEITRFSNADDSGWKFIDLTPYIVPQVFRSPYFRIAFHYGARTEWYWLLDDFSIVFMPDTVPPLLELQSFPSNTYSVSPDTIRVRVYDLSPNTLNLWVVSSDTVIAQYRWDLECEKDTVITVVIPSGPPGTLYDCFISAEDFNHNKSALHFSWWKLFAYSPGTLEVFPSAEPIRGVKLSWSSPRQRLAYYKTPISHLATINSSDIVVTKFSPQYVPCRLDEVRALFYGVSGQVRLKIYSDSGNFPQGVIFDTLVAVPVSPDVFEINLSDKGLVLNGDFYVGFEWISPNVANPCFDDTSLTLRNLMYVSGDGNWHFVPYDWIMECSVTYFPQSRPLQSKAFDFISLTNATLKKAKLVENDRANLESIGKSLSEYEILRSTVSGGSYTTIGRTVYETFFDTTCEDQKTYYYKIMLEYTRPDTTTFSNEASITTDFSGPSFSQFFYRDLGNGAYLFQVKITDPSGVLADTMFYALREGGSGYTLHDSVVNDVYYYTLNYLPASFKLYLSFTAVDDSPFGRNKGRFPPEGYIEVEKTSDTTEVIPPSDYGLNVKVSCLFRKWLDLEYTLPERSEVEIYVYSLMGQKVATLVKDVKDAGTYSLRWSGRGEGGEKLGSGVYIVKMVTPKKVINQRVILTK